MIVSSNNNAVRKGLVGEELLLQWFQETLVFKQAMNKSTILDTKGD